MKSAMKGLIAALILLIIIGLLLGLQAEDFVGDDPEKPAGDATPAAGQNIPEANEFPANSSTENGNTDAEADDPVENEEDDRDPVDSPPPSKKVEGIPALW